MSALREGSLRRQEEGGTAEASRFKLPCLIHVVSPSGLNRSCLSLSSMLMLLPQFKSFEGYVICIPVPGSAQFCPESAFCIGICKCLLAALCTSC